MSEKFPGLIKDKSKNLNIGSVAKILALRLCTKIKELVIYLSAPASDRQIDPNEVNALLYLVQKIRMHFDEFDVHDEACKKNLNVTAGSTEA